MHDHHHHHHHSHTGSHKALLLAILLTLGFAAIEALGGLWSGSLVLLGDAGHVASDSLALAISAFAAWVALKPPSHKHSYGLGRAEIIAAWVSSVVMLVIALVIIVEAIRRFDIPLQVRGGPVMVIAAAGLLLNLGIAWMLARRERTLNIRAILLHVLSDILGTFAVLISGAVIYFTHWTKIDPILSIVIGVLIIFSSLRLLRESITILMEGVPDHLDLHEVQETLSQQTDVKAVHDLHIWTLSSGKTALSAHIDIDNITKWDEVLLTLKSVLHEKYHIDHITLQPEIDVTKCEPCYKP